MNVLKHNANLRFSSVVLFGLLSVVVLESVVCGDLLDAPKITAAAQAKGSKFLKGFKTGTNQQTRQIGKFTEFSTDVAGRNGQSFTRWNKVVNENGRTIRLYHDTFDNTGKFIHRGIKVPGPERHVR